ncbi:MAG: hypothetical protein ACK5PP_04380 [Acidimicrobiales bacterium]
MNPTGGAGPPASAGRTPIPPGRISTIRGRWQRPALRRLSQVILALAVVGTVLPEPARHAVAMTVVGLVMAAPISRVAWLVFRWWQEQDRTFIAIGVALLGVVASGGVLALLGLE